ncbi:DUF4124 domain-containing protein [Rhodanobacter sp. C05]|uniref:DUF4124 domain-containing protein n=1 Tax=Rhodanobacter sp. C05 TaxID=1945855 RepID=UPI000985AC5D|nr:DUF4124 domain-containing protein [Rhodanobacter sp. C05]OOG43324.1 hypothetical protein B0E51_00460 [Rhodanobacter sp. C05]
MRRLAALLLLLAITVPAIAGTVYKCSSAAGQVTYQDAPCPKTQAQETLQLSDSTSAPSPAVPVPASTTAAVDDTPAAPPPSVPNVPLPQLYGCVHAVDGSAYVSSNGNPPPFLAPMGVLGTIQAPLAQAYAPGGAGVSAPEVSRGKVTAGLIASNYVQVQDRCRPLSAPEICHELRDEYEKNAEKLRRAFQSDQPPLQRRDDELRAQLANC